MTGKATAAVPGQAQSRSPQIKGFWVHVAIYVIVNSLLTAGWAMGGGGFFWPIYLMTAWGLGVVVNGFLAFGRRPGGDGPPRTR
jgi:hypothetical protein